MRLTKVELPVPYCWVRKTEYLTCEWRDWDHLAWGVCVCVCERERERERERETEKKKKKHVWRMVGASKMSLPVTHIQIWVWALPNSAPWSGRDHHNQLDSSWPEKNVIFAVLEGAGDTGEVGFPPKSSSKGGWEALAEIVPALPSSCKTFLICCVILSSFFYKDWFLQSRAGRKPEFSLSLYIG